VREGEMGGERVRRENDRKRERPLTYVETLERCFKGMETKMIEKGMETKRDWQTKRGWLLESKANERLHWSRLYSGLIRLLFILFEHPITGI